MSDEEFERFEVTQYDIDNEFNVNRSRKRQSKHQQIYGIWADESDDENTEAEFGRKRKEAKQKNADLSAPIGFVSAGVQTSTKSKNSQDDKRDAETEIETVNAEREKVGPQSSSEDEETPLDKQIPQRAGFGHKSHKKQADDFENIAGFRRPEAVSNNRSKHQLSQQGCSFSFQSCRKQKLNENLGLGKWEKHTKGIGAKLLLKMGYEPGRGLGKDLQGIQRPVEAHLRKGRGSVGAYGPEKHSKVGAIETEIDDSKAAVAGEEASSTATAKRKRNREARTIVTVDELLARNRLSDKYLNYEDDSEITQVKVIDMTGPEKRIFSGYENISETSKAPMIQSSMPIGNEFLRRCRTIVGRHERHVIDCNHMLSEIQSRYETDHEDLLELEKVQETYKSIVKQVNRIDEFYKETTAGVEVEAVVIKIVQIREKLDRKQYEHLAPYLKSVISKKLNESLSEWRVFDEPLRYFQLFRNAKDWFAEAAGSTLKGKEDDLFKFVMKSVIVARIKTELWKCNVRDCDPVIVLLENWSELMPNRTYRQLIDNFVVSKLKTAVANWDPQTDMVPLHTWLHPWIVILGCEIMEKEIFSIVSEKLSVALNEWHPSDQSAKLLLRPWQEAVEPGTFVAFLVKHIVPKLQGIFRFFEINPSQQNFEIWNWVMDWADLLPVTITGQLIEEHFLEKWFQALMSLLNQAHPNFSQITDWLHSWKSLIPAPVYEQTAIRDMFDRGLSIIKRSSSRYVPPTASAVPQFPMPPPSISTFSLGPNMAIPLHHIAATPPPPPSSSVFHCHTMPPPQPPQPPTLRHPFATPPLPPPPPRITQAQKQLFDPHTNDMIPTLSSFRDLVNQRLSERGTSLIPVPNQFVDSNQQYACNNVRCYLSKNVIFVKNGSNWQAVSLNMFLNMI